MFQTGQKVVCVDGKFDPVILKFYKEVPVEGVTYTVRGTTVGISPKGEEGELCVYVVELNNPCSEKPPHMERGFNANRFAPLEVDAETNYEYDYDSESRPETVPA